MFSDTEDDDELKGLTKCIGRLKRDLDVEDEKAVAEWQPLYSIIQMYRKECLGALRKRFVYSYKSLIVELPDSNVVTVYRKPKRFSKKVRIVIMAEYVHDYTHRKKKGEGLLDTVDYEMAYISEIEELYTAIKEEYKIHAENSIQKMTETLEMRKMTRPIFV